MTCRIGGLYYLFSINLLYNMFINIEKREKMKQIEYQLKQMNLKLSQNKLDQKIDYTINIMDDSINKVN